MKAFFSITLAFAESFPILGCLIRRHSNHSMNAKLILFSSCFAAVTLAASGANAGPRRGGGGRGGGQHIRSMPARGGATFSRGASGTFHNWSGRNWNGRNWNGRNWNGRNWRGGNWSGGNWGGNQFIFAGGLGFPFFYGYPYYGYYPYGYYSQPDYGYGYCDQGYGDQGYGNPGYGYYGSQG